MPGTLGQLAHTQMATTMLYSGVTGADPNALMHGTPLQDGANTQSLEKEQ